MGVSYIQPVDVGRVVCRGVIQPADDGRVVCVGVSYIQHVDGGRVVRGIDLHITCSSC